MRLSGVSHVATAVKANSVEFETCKHEVDERLPAGEVEIPGQGLHIVEEGLAGGEFRPHPAVLFVAQIQGGVKQERHQVEHDEHHCQVLLAVAEVMLKMVTVVFEHVVVFIFALPTGAGGARQRRAAPDSVRA